MQILLLMSGRCFHTYLLGPTGHAWGCKSGEKGYQLPVCKHTYAHLNYVVNLDFVTDYYLDACMCTGMSLSGHKIPDIMNQGMR